MIGIASFFTTKFMNNTMNIIIVFSAIIFLLLIIPIFKVKNFPKNKEERVVPLKQKLNNENKLDEFTKCINSLNELFCIVTKKYLTHNNIMGGILYG